MEDPGPPLPPSAAAPDPDPTPPPGEEEGKGDRWVLVPAAEVEGADAPKVFHWENLQQELARLWSLSMSVPASASLRFRSHQENVAGVKLPKFTHFVDPAAASGGPSNASPSLTGLARGGQQVAACRAAHVKAIEVLVELASLQTSFLTLDEAIKTRIENTITYIKGELDELEREDFFRLKKIQGYKKREIERQMAAARQFAEDNDIIF